MEIEARRDECEHSSVELSPRCPECNSQRIFRDGVRKTRDGKVQRFLCRECGFRFSGPSAKHRKELGVIIETAPLHFEESQPHENDAGFDFEDDIDSLSPDEEAPKECDGSHPDHINLSGHFSNRRVCAEAKNLAATETTRTVVAGEISETKSLLLQFALHMKKQGRAESTILTRGRQMAVLAKRGANLLDPESIKEAIANQPWANKRKETAVGFRVKSHGAGIERRL